MFSENDLASFPRLETEPHQSEKRDKEQEKRRGNEEKTCNPRDQNRIIGSREGDRDLFRLKAFDRPLKSRVSVRQIHSASAEAGVKRNSEGLEGPIKSGGNTITVNTQEAECSQHSK